MQFSEIAILGIVTVSALAVFLSALQFGPIRERARTRAIHAIAGEIGFDPSLPPPTAGLFGPGRQNFALFNRGQARTARVLNLLTGTGQHEGTYLFDYQVGIGFGHYYHTWEMTVASLELGARRFPNFSIRPTHGTPRKVDPFADDAEIHLTSYPDFQALYILEGDSESAVRGVLSDNLIRHLERDGNLWLECRDGWMAYHRTNVRVAPEHLERFANEAEWALDEMDRGRRI